MMHFKKSCLTVISWNDYNVRSKRWESLRCHWRCRWRRWRRRRRLWQEIRVLRTVLSDFLSHFLSSFKESRDSIISSSVTGVITSMILTVITKTISATNDASSLTNTSLALCHPLKWSERNQRSMEDDTCQLSSLCSPPPSSSTTGCWVHDTCSCRKSWRSLRRW